MHTPSFHGLLCVVHDEFAEVHSQHQWCHFCRTRLIKLNISALFSAHSLREIDVGLLSHTAGFTLRHNELWDGIECNIFQSVYKISLAALHFSEYTTALK